jgi:hypothetical protein
LQRLLHILRQTDTLDGKGQNTSVRLVSLFTDQVPASDVSRRIAGQHSIPIFDSVRESLTMGSGKLAVDGVVLVAEHGDYPVSDTGQTVYPKRRLMEQVFEEFRASGRSVPVFCDKHLADNWQDAKWIYDTAQELKVPLMAGSSLPGLWRYPPTDVKRGAKLKEIVAISYHTLDAYGFHALEMVQALAERRAGGETGIHAVQCITGPAVWEPGCFDRRLLDQALAQMKRPLPTDKRIEELATEPIFFSIEYRDGLRTSVLTLNYAVGEWASAWRYDDDSTDAALFWTQESRPFHHFNYLVQGVEKMMYTGKSTWPVERTLMTSGVLDALLISKRDGAVRLETPQLEFAYQSDWDWQQPPPPPPDRAIALPPICIARNACRRTISNCHSQSSSVKSSSALRRTIPSESTMPWTPPSFSSASEKIRSTSLRCVASPRQAKPPTSPATAWVISRPRPTHMTFAPACVNAWAAWRPIPCPAPITT